jgi:hypothetical protein
MASKAEASLVKVILSYNLNDLEKAFCKALASRNPQGSFKLHKIKGSGKSISKVVEEGDSQLYFTYTFDTPSGKQVRITAEVAGFSGSLIFSIKRYGYVDGQAFTESLPHYDFHLHVWESIIPGTSLGEYQGLISTMLNKIRLAEEHDIEDVIAVASSNAKARKIKTEQRKNARTLKSINLKQQVFEKYNIHITRPPANIETLYEAVSKLGTFDKISEAFGKILPLLK